jgi:UDP-N-acetylmuramoyl-tripeptide--D-alanyl-D-alanine ligase
MAPFQWTAAAVREALGLGGIGPSEPEPRTFRRVWTDSRTVQPGDLFVALEGPSFDGHDFLAAAAAQGATGAVVRRVPAGRPADLPLFPVTDTVEALGALAHYRRLRLSARVVAITGSSGKTTTKELLRAALAGHRRIHVTEANLNNRIGAPLTLLAAPDDAQVVVVEVGTNEPGEIAALRAVVHPDVAVITTVSEAHVERLGDLEGVYREKLSLLHPLPAGAWVVTGDEPAALADRAREVAPGHGLRVAGLTDAADQPWRGRLLEADPEGRWRVALPSGSFETPVPGAHGARCALVALAVADLLGVPPEAASRGFPATRLPGMRAEVRRLRRGTLLVDCYNANPQSTVAALDWLAALPSRGPRIAVLATMGELGARSDILHREVLEEGWTRPLDALLMVGAFARAAEAGAPGPDGPRILQAPDVEGALPLLLPLLEDGATLLLKGSRSMRLERLLPSLEAVLSGADEPEEER